MGKIQINPDLKRLSKEQFKEWFESRKELKNEDFEARYKELHPAKKKAEK